MKENDRGKLGLLRLGLGSGQRVHSTGKPTRRTRHGVARTWVGRACLPAVGLSLSVPLGVMRVKRRSILKGLFGAQMGATAAGFRLPLAQRGRLQRQAVRVRASGRRLGPDQLLRPEGKHAGRARHQPLGGARRDPASGQHRGMRPLPGTRRFLRRHYRNMLVINGVDAQTNSHTRRHRAQLERAELRRVSDDERAARSSLRRRDLPVAVPELRRIFEDRVGSPATRVSTMRHCLRDIASPGVTSAQSGRTLLERRGTGRPPGLSDKV